MKLKSYSTVTCQSKGKDVKPFIHINTKTGLFTINKAACELIGAAKENHVILHQNESEPTEWFMQIITAKKSDGFTLREKHEISKGLLFNNTSLTRAIADSVEFTGISGRLFIGEKINVKGVGELHTIITAGLRTSE